MDKPAPWHAYGCHMILHSEDVEEVEVIKQTLALDTIQYLLKAGEDLNRYKFEFITKDAIPDNFIPKTVAFKATLKDETLTPDEQESRRAYKLYQWEQMKAEHERQTAMQKQIDIVNVMHAESEHIKSTMKPKNETETKMMLGEKV